MLTVKQVLECVCVRFTFPSSWNTLSVFLRVSFQGARYQYNCLPFGHFLAPRTFSKCVETALEMKGPVLSGRPVANGTVAGRGGGADGQACRTPVSPGFYGELEEEHSSPLPEAYLFGCGVGLLSMESASLSLSQERLDALTELLRRVVPLTVVTALSITRLLGLMSVAHVVVPP